MTPAFQPQPETITLEKYEALPEEKRIEVFEGIIYDMASPSQIHQSLSMQLSTAINSYILRKKGSCSVFSAPFDVKLFDKPLTIVQPDIMIICDKNKLDGKRCNGAPDFIIEIVSPGNPADDYIRKLYYYKNAGVREYWIVVNIFDDLWINFSDISDLLNIYPEAKEGIICLIRNNNLVDFMPCQNFSSTANSSPGPLFFRTDARNSS